MLTRACRPQNADSKYRNEQIMNQWLMRLGCPTSGNTESSEGWKTDSKNKSYKN